VTIDISGDRLREGRKVKGMNVTIVTSAKDDNSARTLFEALRMPFRQGA